MGQLLRSGLFLRRDRLCVRFAFKRAKTSEPLMWFDWLNNGRYWQVRVSPECSRLLRRSVEN